MEIKSVKPVASTGFCLFSGINSPLSPAFADGQGGGGGMNYPSDGDEVNNFEMKQR